MKRYGIHRKKEGRLFYKKKDKIFGEKGLVSSRKEQTN